MQLEESSSRTGQRVLVGELSGVWAEGVKAWTLDVRVTSDKGETYRSRLRIK